MCAADDGRKNTRGATLTMVYNNAVYRPASLSERLQARFGERAAKAVSGASSKGQTSYNTGEVLSFFGRVDDNVTANRAIPKKRRVQPSTDTAQQRAQQRVQQPRTASVGSAATREFDRRAVQAGARKAAGAQKQRVGARAQATPEITRTFTRAYAAGERVRQTAESYSGVAKRRYAVGAMPSGALRRGRSNISGARHAVLVTSDSPDSGKGIIATLKDAFGDRHIAEHRVKKDPFPLAFVTLVGICAFMVMVLIFSFSQVHEYNSNISNLKNTQSELAEQAAKLEVLLEERDDIREIEKIAVEKIGMVSSDTVQSKFVSVGASDRVEVIKTEPEETEGGFSALLSVIGESLGQIGEYFN